MFFFDQSECLRNGLLTPTDTVYKPNLRQKSDADIMQDAQLQAIGLQPKDHESRQTWSERNQTATDHMVCSLSNLMYMMLLNTIRSWNASRSGCANEIHAVTPMYVIVFVTCASTRSPIFPL